ncbi:MAG TPA: hypothetical protein ENL42_06655, partial [Thermoplasmatales archaeon]|nr:hypothetical protein [Thermoplasmatales archaeon]
MKICIIGCGAAGGTAAQFARKTNRNVEIVVYDREGYGQYSKCALPFVIGGMEWRCIIEFPPEWFRKNGIEYRKEEIHRVDLENGIVEGEKEEEFDKLIIASGASPACPFEANNAYSLRTLDDALAIREKAEKAKKVIIVGAGLIGMEVAEALIKAGKDVKILEYMPQILPGMLDKDVADYVMKKLSIDVILNCRVKRVDGGTVEGSDCYEADMSIIATGNKPNTFDGKAIEVNERCEVREGVYAAGDCTIIKDFFGRSIAVGLGSIAARQGKVAGSNA